MKQISNLKYPPIKYRPLKDMSEEVLFHAKKVFFDYPAIDYFIMLKPKNPNIRTYMSCVPDYLSEKEANSLYILKLISTPARNGFGTKMLDFAQTYSKKVGCNGNFHLEASSGYTPNSIPHIFYRKYGMNTMSPEINRKLDKFIKKKKPATYRDIPDIEMYYPPIKEKENLFQKFIRKIIFTLSKI